MTENSPTSRHSPETMPLAETMFSPPASAPESDSSPPNTCRSSPLDSVRFAKIIARSDVLIVTLVLLLAFLCASSRARNSDLWMHLATGKALVQGRYHFGSDPFAHTVEGVYWVNHFWLYDLLCYALYQTLGGSSLVLFKVALVVLLAVVLLRLSWEGGSLWVPAVCTGLAILAISCHLLLQPIYVSYLFLALTLWFLEKPRRIPTRRAESARSWRAFLFYWPLVPLFVLWVNLDGWFLLGPLTVALYWLGHVLDGWRAVDRTEQREQARTLGLVTLASLAACLLNPHHVHAFVLPYQLGFSGAGAALRQNALFRGLFLSPFEDLYFRASFGLNAAGLAYFPLVLLGVLSFAINWRDWRWRRALIWLAFFVLSAYQARAIPFFAVVAGPVMAFNFHEFAARHRAPARAWAFGGRLLTVFITLGLVVAAWPGWLQAPPYEPRDWTVEVDPSLQQAAARINEWRRDGRLDPQALVFHSSLDAANYFAWACPEERGFFLSLIHI